MLDSSAPLVVGANLPWITYGCDFGANHWRPRGGLASTAVSDDIRRTLDASRERGVTVLRWFLFCDGRAGITFDGNRPTGIDDFVCADIDAALALAARADQRVMFVLFDFHWCKPASWINGVQMAGHRKVLARASLRLELIDRVVTPVLERYAGHPGIAAWDIINEPEWVTFGLGRANPFGSVFRRQMRAFIGDTCERARTITSQPVTVGLASARWLALVDHAGLDFYQIHWYDEVERGLGFRSVHEFNLDRPVILGEFPTRGSAHTPDALFEMADRAGYRGAFLWSLLADDGATDQAEAFRALSARHEHARDAYARRESGITPGGTT